MTFLDLCLFAQRVEEFRCTNCDDGSPGPLEWIGAGAGVIGGIAAVLALVLTRSSAHQAKQASASANRTAAAAERTAQAAEEEAELSREQVASWRVERSKKPQIETSVRVLSVSQPAPDAPPTEFLLRLSFRNVGDRAASRVLANAAVPKGAGLRLRPHEAFVFHSSVSEEVADLGNGSETISYWNGILHDVDVVGAYEVDVMLITQPTLDAEMPLELSVSWDGVSDYSSWVVHASSGGSVTVTRAA
ncbi:hypothetical protein OJ997_00295 [Solirubrobacter phytolaccae]|uniref:Uncharacterized protein n=1 Tax=Solirubrobacter phytolaccae TaxID=1404360 RepID=A0A9X3N5J0_9ACTN|nr:hypothetical protein [Solirubrobacter phytolaccae]MDA0178717.1 hypothetical protein [Solirubrobacter phytolaccae]